MNDLEKLIEDVARELRHCDYPDRLKVLQRRLLPLLEAGQAMREAISRIEKDQWMILYSSQWDAALEKAKHDSR